MHTVLVGIPTGVTSKRTTIRNTSTMLQLLAKSKTLYCVYCISWHWTRSYNKLDVTLLQPPSYIFTLELTHIQTVEVPRHNNHTTNTVNYFDSLHHMQDLSTFFTKGPCTGARG